MSEFIEEYGATVALTILGLSIVGAFLGILITIANL